MGSTPILTNIVGVHSRNINIKFKANACSGSREVYNGIIHNDKKFYIVNINVT